MTKNINRPNPGSRSSAADTAVCMSRCVTDVAHAGWIPHGRCHCAAFKRRWCCRKRNDEAERGSLVLGSVRCASDITCRGHSPRIRSPYLAHPYLRNRHARDARRRWCWNGWSPGLPILESWRRAVCAGGVKQRHCCQRKTRLTTSWRYRGQRCVMTTRSQP